MKDGGSVPNNGQFLVCRCSGCRHIQFYEAVAKRFGSIAVHSRVLSLFTRLRDTPEDEWLCIRAASAAYQLSAGTVVQLRVRARQGLESLPLHAGMGNRNAAMPTAERQFVLSHLSKLASEAVALPWRLHVMLPEQYSTWEEVYNAYAASIPINHLPISFTSWRRLKKEHFPLLKLDTAEVCFCGRCKELISEHARAVGGEKGEVIARYRQHQKEQLEARRLYQSRKELRSKATESTRLDKYNPLLPPFVEPRVGRANRDAVTSLEMIDTMMRWSEKGGCRPKEFLGSSLRLSADYKQSVPAVKTKKQTQAEYQAKKPMREVFGVVDTGLPKGFLYVHGREAGHKSSNSVANILLHHLFWEWRGQEQLWLYLDNCGGQNKNRTVLALLYLLVETGIFQRTHLCFMMPGHSKFDPDELFGATANVLKRRSWLNDGELLAHLSLSCFGGRRVTVRRVREIDFVDLTAQVKKIKFRAFHGIQKQRELVVTSASCRSGTVWHQQQLGLEFEGSTVISGEARIAEKMRGDLRTLPTGSPGEEVKMKADILKCENRSRLEPEVCEKIEQKEERKHRKKTALRRKVEERAKAARERSEIEALKATEQAKRNANFSTNSPEMRHAAKSMRHHLGSKRTPVGSQHKLFQLLQTNQQFQQKLLKRKRRKNNRALKNREQKQHKRKRNRDSLNPNPQKKRRGE